MRLYLDTAPVIYLVQGTEGFSDAVERAINRSGVELIVSHLTRMECRVLPVRSGDSALLQDFDRFFSDDVQETVSLDAEVMDRATTIRAEYGFSTPDAIHLASAVIGQCDIFLTADIDLARFPDIRVQVVSSEPLAS